MGNAAVRTQHIKDTTDLYTDIANGYLPAVSIVKPSGLVDGHYYDSGYIQPVDFFGDGTRIPMIVVSPYTQAGHVSHDYGDHVSVLKFIERNWGLRPLTRRSRDNLPNPITLPFNAYAPVNGPAIGDLYDLFDFRHGGR
jgi:phospholipase C